MTNKLNMKTLRVLTISGMPQPGWQFGTAKALNITLGRKPRRVSGWTLISPDGCERFNEGNWQQFAPFANLVLDNYGCRKTLS